jgi:3-phenylpropionate/trans-cinnamate dioxygenase alpha subunit
MKLCRLDEGSARRLTCPFHGWTYDSDGKLVGVPQLSNAYYDELDRGKWGLIEVPRVESYRGLIFACMSIDVANLTDYLGDAKWYLDIVFALSSEGLEALPGAQHWNLRGNWKLGAENFGGDNYHTPTAHASFIRLGQVTQFGGNDPWERDFEIKLDGGHGILCITAEYPPDVEQVLRPYFKRVAEKSRREGRLNEEQARHVLGGVHVGTIFPNFSYSRVLGCLTVRTWHPRGVDNMSVQVAGLVEKDVPTEVRKVCRRMMIRGLGATGLIEADDAAVWAGCQETLSGVLRGNFPLNYQMGAGHERTEPGRPGLICASPTEVSSFGFYERWAELTCDGEEPRTV